MTSRQMIHFSEVQKDVTRGNARQPVHQLNHPRKGSQITVEPIRKKSGINLIKYLEVKKEEVRNVFLNAI